VNTKPTAEDLGIDPDALNWQRSGPGDDAGSGSIEVAFARASGTAGRAWSSSPETPAEWVLMRVAGDPGRRVLVFDPNEWGCFLDGARNGEFDDAAGDAAR
jgi:hypothetical protein